MGHGTQKFISSFQGLGKWGDELYPWRRFACPGLLYFALSGRKMDSRFRGNDIEVKMTSLGEREETAFHPSLKLRRTGGRMLFYAGFGLPDRSREQASRE